MSDTKKTDATVEQKKDDAQVENKTTDATVDAGKKKDEQVDAGAAMQARCAAITGCEEAKGREGLANHIAFKTTMSVDEAKSMLAASPKQSAATGKSPLDSAMDNSGGGADIANNGGDEEEQARGNDGGLLGAYTAATGNKAVLKVVK